MTTFYVLVLTEPALDPSERPSTLDNVELVPDAHDGEQEPTFERGRPDPAQPVRVERVHGRGGGGHTPATVRLDPRTGAARTSWPRADPLGAGKERGQRFI
jgi:hypothetical protein